MTLSDFTATTHGKWILCGEHAVLRGHDAIVYPVLSKSLTLCFSYSTKAVSADFQGEFPDDIHLLFWSVLEAGLKNCGHNLSEITGHFDIQNSIPVGAGMGGSAALCTALAKWFAGMEMISDNDTYAFARQLEHLFHNESSGLDIAGALATQGILYNINGTQIEIEQQWQPHWYLSHTQQLGITSHCVKQVKALIEKQPEIAAAIDQDMQESVTLAERALKQTSGGLNLLAKAINQAHNCFQRWGLTGGKIDHHVEVLLSHGALAAKPTGSGHGGFVLSLWAKEPDDKLGIDFIAL